jgi:PAS domain S-box-containing protein
MAETIFQELKRYVHFGTQDEAVLHCFLPMVEPYFGAITESFYRRLQQHPEAWGVFVDDAQVARLQNTLQEWLGLLFRGPWDEAYYERRARIGRVHVQIALPQRYMFAAMNLIRDELMRLTEVGSKGPAQRTLLQSAVNKVLDLELAIMLESYRQAFVDSVQRTERMERDDLVRQLALSEARHDEIVEKAEALITTSDQAGRIVLFNGKCEQVTGFARAAAKGQNWLEMFVQSSDRHEVARLQHLVLSGRTSRAYEGPVQADSVAHRRVRWHFTTLPGGASPAVCAIGIDVTNEYELAVRTRRAERLAALGTMAAGLAHEIRNPLNSAHLQLNVARRRLARPERRDDAHVLKAMEQAEIEMKRLATLVQDFLQFARPQPLRLSLIDLRETTRGVVDFMTPEARAAGVHVRLEGGHSVPIEVDEEKVKQVLLNLLRNAIEAAGREGRIAVRIREIDSMGEVSIEDDGPGWAADAPIFEPFFTTKDTGTGLGLAIVHRIVMDHGGTLDANSRPGRTTFTIQFPRAYQSASAHA